MDGHCLLPWACKCCNALKFDWFDFDSLAGKHQKRQNFPHQNFALYSSYVKLSSAKYKLIANYCNTDVATIILHQSHL